ncbi:DUF3016 domain-containing protein [Pseudoalteromonas rubra]|uniref:DUF3016 domain-containing protein n=1 Tax=Pseudoalteromonas rubra TaxID=43658 RepID=A0A5S3WRG4_9GAMM|nr:DUF3016 domain-containing protein [Pseudoalteromonas rubra]TMP31555.1 DUF3016 domain-containing protein [Pseudoalteromonas rubra]TMP34639.1 DUF3016 domain-containing protein [Pseudoalteromonas rubra]
MKYLYAITLVCLSPLTTLAGETNVTWRDFKEYRDVVPANESKAGYYKRIASQFEKHLSKLMSDAPQGYQLDITFDDIDLAGDVRFNMHDIRIVKPIFFPRLKISYTLTDNAGAVLAQAEEMVLKDLSFMDRVRTGRDSEFYYDKRLLSTWYKEEIADKLKG